MHRLTKRGIMNTNTNTNTNTYTNTSEEERVPANPFTYEITFEEDGETLYILDSETWHAIRNVALNAACSLELIVEGSITAEFSGETMAAESEELLRIFYAEPEY